MRKNVAGQIVAAQLVSTSDGSDVTSGTTTVYTTIDGGTQDAGVVATHEGNGCWTYAPSQANTNGDHIAYTFTNSSAISVTVNVYQVSFDYTDAVRIGLTALPNAAAEAAGGLYTRGTGAGQINQAANGQVDANAVALAGTAQDATDLADFAAAGYDPVTNKVQGVVLVDTTTVNTDMVSEPPTAGTISAAVWDEDATGHQTTGTFGQAIGDPVANTKTLYAAIITDAAGASVTADVATVDTVVDGIQTDLDNGTDGLGAIKTAVDGLNDPTAAAVADAVWDEDATGHQTLGTYGQAIGDPVANTKTLYAALITDAAGASVTADVATVDTVVDGIQTDLDNGTDGLGALKALIDALNDVSAADVLTQVNAALDTAIAELGVAVPTATPTLRTGLMLMYMALRNQLKAQTSGTDALEIYNDAGTLITQKLLTDDGADYVEAKMT